MTTTPATRTWTPSDRDRMIYKWVKFDGHKQSWVADQLGSIEIGKRANLVLTTGNPMQASSQVQAVFIDGKPLEPTSKQTRLYDRYKERLREVQEGRAPLGTK